MTPVEHALYAISFIDTYDQYTDNQKALREAACLKFQYTHCIQPPEADDLLCGKYENLCVGFSMQNSGMGYYFDHDAYHLILDHLPSDLKNMLNSRIEAWLPKTGKQQLINSMPASMKEIIPTEHFEAESNVGFWLCRMSSTQLDFDKLLQKGIPGLTEELHLAQKMAPDEEFYQGMELLLLTLQEVLLHCRRIVLESTRPDKDAFADMLLETAFHKPSNFYQAAQLMYIYAILSGTYNYGRMDEYLGDFFVRDIEQGVMTCEQAESILASLWKLMNHRQTTWDGRVIIGGLGRRNEKNADALALSIIRVSGRVKDILPQLSLRFYNGQNPSLMDLALSVIGKGCVYPILYNDDVNVPAVEKAFCVPREEAIHYVPFGCGEYVLYHRSTGTPSDIVNLLKALEITLFNGFDPVSRKTIGLKTGNFQDFSSFDNFFHAYCLQLERYIEVQAKHQALEYHVAASHSPFLAASLLYDDCLTKGKYIFDGGARYIGATYETYGIINTADSLMAIKQLVFDEERISKENLLSMLLQNFKGFEKEHRMLLSAPKYGNDDADADAMAALVENHVCNAVSATAKKNGLHTHLTVVINNSANTTLGKFTLASADGRKSGEPMANANNPSGGSDKNGLTALLNSLSGFPVGNNAGSVQNIKLSKDMFSKYMGKTKAALSVYFANGGSQLMITVLGRDDLENALKEPEKYKNLIVRVGGFCARFVELEPKVQQEVLSRTLY